MKQATITISFEDEKLSAVRRYMQKKKASLEDELIAQLTKLYEKHVPVGVQEYINERNADDAPVSTKRQSKQGGDS
jgi:hypothetical protein